MRRAASFALVLAASAAAAASGGLAPREKTRGEPFGLRQEAVAQRTVGPRAPIRVRADRFTIERQGESTLWEGNVRLTHGGTILLCDRMRTTSGDRRAEGEGRVRMTDREASVVVTSERFVSTDRMNHVTLTGSPRFEHQPPEGGTLTVTGTVLEMDGGRNEAIASGAAEAHWVEAGGQTTDLFAERIRFQRDDEKALATGSPRLAAKLSDGGTVEASSREMDFHRIEARARLRGETETTMADRGGAVTVVTADEAQAFLRQGRFEASGEVRMLSADKGKRLTVDLRSPRLEVTDQRQRARAWGGVELEMKDADGSSTQVTALEVSLHAARRRLEAVGSVLVRQGETVASCGRAEFHEGSGILRLTDFPVVAMRHNVFVGDAISFASGRVRRVTIEKRATGRVVPDELKDQGK